jgi:putative ABC transport system permease protein
LRFDCGGQVRDGRVTSLRRVEWGSMRVNFFVMFPRSRVEGLPMSYISAFNTGDGARVDRALSHDFPNVTLIDVSATVAQLQSVLNQVIAAIEFLFVFALAAGLVVLFATLTASRETRAREYAVMRAIGAPSALLRQVQRAELLGIGALAGLLASVAAMAAGGVLARMVFEFAWAPSPWVPPAGMACGALLALAAGWPGLREVLRRPVMDSLRQAGEG